MGLVRSHEWHLYTRVLRRVLELHRALAAGKGRRSRRSTGACVNGGRGRVWSASSRPGPRLRDQIAVENEVPLPVADVDVSRELTPAEREALDKELEELASKMDSLWKGRADRSEWDEVKADLEVYWLSGETVLEDPRRKETYRQAVLEGLGFGDDAAERRPGMSSDGA